MKHALLTIALATALLLGSATSMSAATSTGQPGPMPVCDPTTQTCPPNPN